MGKDRKQREAYKYIHGDLDRVSPNIQRKWNRMNFREIGQSRRNRKDTKGKDIDKVIEVEVFDYIHI
jgi:hypothetical protein